MQLCAAQFEPCQLCWKAQLRAVSGYLEPNEISVGEETISDCCTRPWIEPEPLPSCVLLALVDPACLPGHIRTMLNLEFEAHV